MLDRHLMDDNGWSGAYIHGVERVDIDKFGMNKNFMILNSGDSNMIDNQELLRLSGYDINNWYA